jgi:hypothetical protein
MEKWKNEVNCIRKGYEKNQKMEKLLCVCRQIFLYTLWKNFLRLLFLIDFSNKTFILFFFQK